MGRSGEQQQQQQHNDGPAVTLESHRSVPAPFLIKTYQLVDDSNTDELISWNEAGTTFIVWRPAEFARDLLPNYFKHNNFSSFVRQLNTYGFRKIVPDRWEFSNDFFRKGERHLLSEIHRRKGLIQPPPPTENRTISPSNSADEQTWSSTSSPSSPTLETLNQKNAMEENEKLKRDNVQLKTELVQMKKLCNNLLLFLSRHVDITPDLVTSFLSNNVASAERLLMLARLKEYLEQHGGEEISKDHYPRSSLNTGLPMVNDSRLAPSSAKEGIASKRVPIVDGLCREEVGRKAFHSVKIEDDDDEKGSPKLFGVPLVSKKRPLPVSSNNGQAEPLVCKIGRCTN
uniref:HSF-type DNA-binding domain-containing protein n=1 Tax=Araucaria cunninghamii TaxID=56994 RepID=A0A0D6R3L9_ARACU